MHVLAQHKWVASLAIYVESVHVGQETRVGQRFLRSDVGSSGKRRRTVRLRYLAGVHTCSLPINSCCCCCYLTQYNTNVEKKRE